MDVVLKTVKLRKSFGAVRALHEVTTQVMRGEITAIIGANGAGKTTFINVITGYVKPDSGEVYYMGKNITGYPPRLITRLGIGRSFQMAQLYPTMSTLDNLLIALASGLGESFNFWRNLRRANLVEEALRLLDQFGIKEYANEKIYNLPEGAKKLLDVALSFGLKPQLLLLDEPTSGVSTKEKFTIMNILIETLRETKTTTIFVEHDMEVVERYADRVLFFDEGEIKADGKPAKILKETDILRILRAE